MMDGPSTKKSTSFDRLVIENITNVQDLKAKLNDIITAGKSYECDVSSCLQVLLKNSDESIVLLGIQAISELVKCEDKREIYAQKEIIEPILDILSKELTSNKFDLFKQCLRALGNLCCDCDTSRKIILECNGVRTMNNLLGNVNSFEELKLLGCKTLLNYAIGGQEFSGSLSINGILERVKKIMSSELEKDDMNDELLSTLLLILSVINDNDPEYLFDNGINIAVLNVLKETANIEISELCLEHLHTQVREHDSVKTVLAKEGGVQLICSRLEQLMQKNEMETSLYDSQVEVIIKQACNLVVLVLTGDEAMPILYDEGKGEVYVMTMKWLESTNEHLVGTALLAVGNFARQDEYCAQMMTNKMFDKLLDIFSEYHKLSLRQKDSEDMEFDKSSVNQIQHAALSAIRNLTVPASNKREAATQGRAAPLLLSALPHVEDHHVAYKLMAALRMLVDGQESVARLVANDEAALRAVVVWGRSAEHAGAAGEAPRLLAWSVRHGGLAVAQVNGCVGILVSMLLATHSVMQNEAILALTLLAIHSNNQPHFVAQLIESEVGKHVSVLIDTNCAKLPLEVAENLLAFFDVTAKCERVLCDYSENKVQNALQKLADARNDFNDVLKQCVLQIIGKIDDCVKEQ